MKHNVLFALAAGVLICLAGCGSQAAADESAGSTPVSMQEDLYPYDLSEYVELRDYTGISYVPYSPPDGSTIAYGDTVTVEIEGHVDGVEEPITGMDTFEVGSSGFLDGFDENLVGQDLNETISMELTFPETYSNSTYAGKTVQLTVHVLILDRSAYRDMNEEALWQIVVNESRVLRYPDAELEQYTEDFRSVYAAFAQQYSMDLNEYLSTFFDASEASLDELCLQNAQALIREEMISYAIFREAGLHLTQTDLDLCKPLWLTTYGYESEADLPVGWEDPGVAASLEKIAVERAVKAYLYDQATPVSS